MCYAVKLLADNVLLSDIYLFIKCTVPFYGSCLISIANQCLLCICVYILNVLTS